MTSYGAQKPPVNFTFEAICTQIDWDTYYNDLAMFE